MHEGPVRQTYREQEYLGDNIYNVFAYTYPGGSYEKYEDYGGHFGVHWSPSDATKRKDLTQLLNDVPGLDNAPNGMTLTCIIGLFETHGMDVGDMSQINDAKSALMEFVDGTRSYTMSLDTGEGSFYWEVDTNGTIDTVGVHTFDSALVEAIMGWRELTASEEILAHGNMIEQHLPPTDTELER